jgi:RNA 2',3'-cyclic 3'-phosphodiesterase
MIRSFIAIDIPAGVKNMIAEAQFELKKTEAAVKWVKPDIIHLTLKFLGNIEEDQIQPIKEKMIESAAGIPSFSMDVTHVGVFPNLRYPRVIWIGLEEKSGKLLTLQKNIEKNLESLGFDPEGRGFSPHLTIGRVKSAKGRGRLVNMLESKQNSHFNESISVNEVNVMKSELKVTGPIYTILETIGLS